MLVDAGPLVALIDRRDRNHGACVSFVAGVREPLITVWPAFTEAMHLLRRSDAPRDLLWSQVKDGVLHFAPLDVEDVPRMQELMTKYADQPMDLADAALVRVAEREELTEIFTLDRRHFAVYRLNGRRRFKIVP